MRARIRSFALGAAAARSTVLGLLAGTGLAGALGWQLVAVPALVLAALAFYRVRRFKAEVYSRLRKGAAAERKVGGSIEYALTAPGCAVAHSVTAVAEVGDIDHLVATPDTLWVVETKYRMVPRERFGEVLRRIAVNVEAARRWAPIGVSVRGCLVLAEEDELPGKRLYENGLVEVFDTQSLAYVLNRESFRPTSEDDLTIARRVWQLSGEELV